MQFSDVLAWITRMLPYILPILLGAGIGYITNAIAIKMLFRPLHEVRIFGIRLPFTPGIIPRQRGQLAESIGRMVSGQLLSREAVLSHLHGEGFQIRMADGIRQVLSQSIEEKNTNGPRAEEKLTEYPPVINYVSALVRKALTKDRLDSAITSGMGKLQSVRVAELLSRVQTPRWLMRLINHQLREGLGPGLAEETKRIVSHWIRDNEKVGLLLTQDLRSAVIQACEGYYYSAVEYLLEWLRKPEFRPELTRRGKTILSGILAQLTAVQRFLLSAGQYDKTLNERMPGIIESLLDTLEKFLHHKENKERIILWMSGGLDRIADKTMAETQGLLQVDLANLAEHGVFQALELLKKERLGLRVRIGLDRFLKRHQNHSLAVLLRWATGATPEAWAGRFSGALFTWVERPGSLEGLLYGAFKILPKVDGQANQGDEEKTVESLTQGLTRLLERTVPPLVERFDIRSMVVDRINGLDVKDVEALLLDIMARQFKWINVFGAILGALIGASQLLIP